MFSKLTYKKKFIYLAVLLVLFSFLAYSMAIKKTVELRREYIKIEKEITTLEDIPSTIIELKAKNAEYDKIFDKSYSTKPVQVFILDYVADYCKSNRIIIKDYPQPHIYENENFVIESNKITLKGDFIPILKLIYSIEQNFRIGKVSSVKYYKVLNLKTKQNELFAEIFIQTVKRSNNEVKN